MQNQTAKFAPSIKIRTRHIYLGGPERLEMCQFNTKSEKYEGKNKLSFIRNSLGRKLRALYVSSDGE